MAKCKYYNKWTWAEPPLEPGDNGTLITEYECKNAIGYFRALCAGSKELCDLPDNQNKALKEKETETNRSSCKPKAADTV